MTLVASSHCLWQLWPCCFSLLGSSPTTATNSSKNLVLGKEKYQKCRQTCFLWMINPIKPIFNSNSTCANSHLHTPQPRRGHLCIFQPTLIKSISSSITNPLDDEHLSHDRRGRGRREEQRLVIIILIARTPSPAHQGRSREQLHEVRADHPQYPRGAIDVLRP